MNKPSLIFALLISASSIHAEDEPAWAEKSQFIGVQKEMPAGELDKAQLDALTQIGEGLFTDRFTERDGVGRPRATQAILPTKAKVASPNFFMRTSGLDANACSSCHNEPRVGGAGGFAANVFLSEGFTNAVFDTTDAEFSNERGTNHLFGAGLVELLAREMTAELTAIRQQAITQAKEKNEIMRVALVTKGVNFGFFSVGPDGIADFSELEGIDPDLNVRPFSQKGVILSLRQFSVNASNMHHGMQATERYGERWTGETDFDEDGVGNELSDADISAMVAWQASLEPPVLITPDDVAWAEASKAGEVAFNDMGCNSCHMQSLPLASLKFQDPGPLDAAGTLSNKDVETAAIYDLELLDWAKNLKRNDKGEILVPLFGDLKRHKMTDSEVDALGNELFSQRFVERDVFMTSELWGVGSTAPYGHRNDFTSLDGIIRAHGGEGRVSRDQYVAADEQTRSAIIAYLKTLQIGDAQ